VKLADVARAAVPGEDVVAAGIFQAGGSLTARMSGFGEFSARRREREERGSSGISFKRYMLLVLTPTRLHISEAQSRLTGWKSGRSLGLWDRSAIQANTEAKSVTIRLSLEIPSENRRIELEAPRARRATSGELARLLAGSTVPPRADLAPPIRTPLFAAQDAERFRWLHNSAGWLATSGGLTRLLAYALPWMVVTPPAGSGQTVGISGFRALGSPVLSLGYSILIVVAGAAYLAGRRESTPRLLRGLGIGSIIVLLIQFPTALSRMGPLRAALQARGLAATVSLGFGVWVELAGAILTLAGGLYAISLSKRTSQSRGSWVPPPPEIEPYARHRRATGSSPPAPGIA
jgi:hypothetical protein